MPRTLIVGGSTGIGAAVAKSLADHGHHVVEMSRSSGVDVTVRDQLADALAATAPVDHVVYSAGHVTPGPFDGLDMAEWDRHLEVNVTAAARVAQWRASFDLPGSIVLVGSTSGGRPSPGWAAYGAAKAALASLGTSLAAEWAPRGLRVYVLAPGRCATALLARLAPDEDPASIMQPGEVADVVRLCVDDVAGVLAGSPIEVKRR